jgi:hypothetical protein
MPRPSEELLMRSCPRSYGRREVTGLLFFRWMKSRGVQKHEQTLGRAVVVDSISRRELCGLGFPLTYLVTWSISIRSSFACESHVELQKVADLIYNLNFELKLSTSTGSFSFQYEL